MTSPISYSPNRTKVFCFFLSKKKLSSEVFFFEKKKQKTFVRLENGFTLLELLVVIAIMGVIVGLIAMRGGDRTRMLRLPGAAQDFATQLRLARLRAIDSGADVTFKPPVEGAIKIGGSHQVVFAPSGAATAGHFTLRDDARAMEISVDALTGRVEVRSAS